MKTIMQNMILLLGVLITVTAKAGYDPSIQRWISLDPIGEPGFETLRGATAIQDIRLINHNLPNGAKNLYTFVGNNPENKIDPLGLQDAENPQDCWQSVEDFYCGDKKGFAKKCCEFGLKALFKVPGAQKLACQTQWSKCTWCCSLSFEGDDKKKAACVANCDLQHALCIVQSF